MNLAGIAGTTGFPATRLRESPHESEYVPMGAERVAPGGGRICWGHSTCWRASYTAKDAESRQKGWLGILGPKSWITPHIAGFYALNFDVGRKAVYSPSSETSATQAPTMRATARPHLIPGSNRPRSTS